MSEASVKNVWLILVGLFGAALLIIGAFISIQAEFFPLPTKQQTPVIPQYRLIRENFTDEIINDSKTIGNVNLFYVLKTKDVGSIR